MAGSVVQVLQFAQDAAATSIAGSVTWTAGEWAHVTLWSDDAPYSDLIDSLGNTFTFIGSQIEAGIPKRVHHFRGQIATGGAATLTGRFFSDSGLTTPASVAWRQMVACRLDGVVAYQSGNQGTDTGSNPTNTLNTTVSVQPAFILMVGVDYQSGTLTAGSGFTDVAFITGSGGGSSLDGRVQSKTVTATGAQGGNFGNSGFDRSVYVIAAFTEGTPDPTPPVLTSPTGAATGAGTATVGATTDEGNGTMYAVVTTSATQPSVAQIKAGQNHTGAAAAWAGTLAISSTGAKTLNATGLTPSTAYYAHLVHTDAATNDSNRVSSAVFTTFQRLLPTSDVSAGTWTSSLGGALNAAIDEVTSDDADYISTETLGDQCVIALQSAGDPASSSNHLVRYRLRGDGTSGIQVSLMQGATVIASWTHDPAPGAWTTYLQTLSGGEADSITDYTALRLRFTEI